MKRFSVGSVVLATDQGLGYLARDFYNNKIVNEVFVHRHSSRTNHYDWYPKRCEKITDLLDICTHLLFFETAFDWSLLHEAKKRGVKTILMPMYECTPHPLPVEPDLIVCPSDLDFRYYQEYKNVVRIDVPLRVPWKLREKARVFVHNAGNGGLGGRNGTAELLEAMKYVQSPIKLIVRSQSLDITSNDPRVEIRRGTVPFKELYDEGDVFVFPEKFNGLSLPLQEAFAAGMLVMSTHRFPMTEWLPKKPLIGIHHITRTRIARVIDSSFVSPVDLAKHIDRWYNKDITYYSRQGHQWAKSHNWAWYKRKYLKLFKNL